MRIHAHTYTSIHWRWLYNPTDKSSPFTSTCSAIFLHHMVSPFIIWFTDSSKSLLPVPLILFQRTFWHLLSDLGFLPSLWFYPNYGSFLPAPSLSYAILIAEYFCQLIFPIHFLKSSRSLLNEVTCCLSVALICTPCVRCSVAELCPTLCDPMDRSLPGSSLKGFPR